MEDWDWFSLPAPDSGRWELFAVESQLQKEEDPDLHFLSPLYDGVTVDSIIVGDRRDGVSQTVLLDQQDVIVYLRSRSEVGVWTAYVRSYDMTWRRFRWHRADELLPEFFKALDAYLNKWD